MSEPLSSKPRYRYALKPCPNCGSDNIVCVRGWMRTYGFECDDCHWSGHFKPTMLEAAQRWNWITPKRLGQEGLI